MLDGLTFLDRRKSIKIPADYPVLSDDYLERLEDHFVEAARIAKKIGFKGVDIKLTHGYLGNELLGARTRPGKYGGSLENRSRFARNIVSKIRSEFGPDFLIATRLGVHDSVPFELDSQTGRGKPRAYPLPYDYGFGVSRENPLVPDLKEPSGSDSNAEGTKGWRSLIFLWEIRTSIRTLDGLLKSPTREIIGLQNIRSLALRVISRSAPNCNKRSQP